MEENTKERIREILDDLLNYQGKELNEKDINELSSMKDELKEFKKSIKNRIEKKLEMGIDENDPSIIKQKSNLTRIELALENITYIIAESVIVLGGSPDTKDIDEDNDENVVETETEGDENGRNKENAQKNKDQVKEKIEERKKIKDPLEAFFISYSNANELIKKIKKELKDDK